MSANYLKLNEDRRKIIVFLQYNKTVLFSQSVNIGGHDIVPVHCVRNLVILFNSSLLTDKQVNSKCVLCAKEY